MMLSIFIHTSFEIAIVDLLPVPIEATKSAVLFCHISLRSALVYILENRHLTFNPNYLDLPENEPLRGKSMVNLHSPTNFGEDRPKEESQSKENKALIPKKLQQMVFFI